MERAPAVGDELDPWRCLVEAFRPADRRLESGQPVEHGLPVGDARIGGDEEGERALHLAEGGSDLHQPAERERAEEIDRAHHQEREDDGDLGIACGQEGEPLGPLHDAVPVPDHAREAILQPLFLGSLARE